jgi:hypothetical protein
MLYFSSQLHVCLQRWQKDFEQIRREQCMYFKPEQFQIKTAVYFITPQCLRLKAVLRKKESQFGPVVLVIIAAQAKHDIRGMGKHFGLVGFYLN